MAALRLAALLLPPLLVTSSSFSAAATDDVRNTTLGAVRGLVNETNQCRSWRGVFYAADAGGQNRFRAPQPRQPWAPAVLDATSFGAGCLQVDHNPDVPTNQSEDCLSLNIFAPMAQDPASVADLPVLLWFHGGTFKEGWSEGPFDLYDGCNMAQGGNAIIVTANYRLGAMGFAVTTGDGGGTTSTTDSDSSSSSSSSSNSNSTFNLRGQFGLYDQVAAMEWLRDNVASFGGDPARVTLFGQSAGSMSVGLHYVSPRSSQSGLFRRVIMESNYPGSNLHTLEQAKVLGDDFCHRAGCFHSQGGEGGEPHGDGTAKFGCDLECLRSDALTAEALEDAWRGAQDDIFHTLVEDNLDTVLNSIMAFAPVLDGDFLPCQITDCLASGGFNASIDALFGTMSGDGATFVYAVDVPLPYGAYEAATKVIWHDPPGTADAILAYYGQEFPAATTQDGRVPLAQVVNDYLFRCSSEVYGREISRAGGVVYSYVFSYVWEMAWLFPEFGLPAACEDIACHSEEIPFVFNNTVPSLNATFAPQEQALSASMVAWWTNFARNGDPNDGSGGGASNPSPLQWPRFTADARQAMHINLDPYIEDGGVALCAGLWDGIGYGY